jgi:hypothetical protein
MDINTIVQLTGMFFIPFLIVFIPLFIGRQYGVLRSKKLAELQRAPVGSVVGAAFGLLAFILAFTFQIAANRYDARKGLLLEEVTNIRTTYLRAGLISEPFRSDTRKMLAEYVALRIELAKDNAKLEFTMSRSQQILDTLWNYSETLAERDRSSEMYALFTSSVNDLVDNYNQRITMTLQYRIPTVVFWTLSFVAFFCMFTLGYQFGISGKGGFRINLLLALIFAMVMFLILVLDNPNFSQLSQKPMITLQKQLK